MLWYLKQLLPVMYRSQYIEHNGQTHVVVWRMWLGRCFNLKRYRVEPAGD